MAPPSEKRDKGKTTQRPSSQTAPVPFFQNRAQLVTLSISVASLLGGGAFFFGALNMRTEFGERIAKVESRLDLMEYFARKQLTAQAQKLLGIDNVQVAIVNQKSNIFYPITPKPPPLPVGVPRR